MSEEKTAKRKTKDSRYLFTLVLAGMGLWFFYDGFFNADIEAVMFNRVGAAILLGWAGWDFHRTRQREQKRAQERAAAAAGEGAPGE
jgi:nicotinamide riboside transporter PnuC